MRYNLLKNLCAVFLLFAVSSISYAQFTAKGTVKDAGGETLIGVTVIVKGTALGTQTNIDGEFEIRVPNSPAELEFSFIGYATQTVDVTDASGRLDIVMAEESTQLSEVVITGWATSVKRSNLANAVSSIDARELSGVTTQQTMDGALYGKFTGANISQNSGAPGGGITVKLRGISTIFSNSQPLYIVDGVFYDNSSARLGLDFVSASQAGGSSSNQDNPTSRIADLDIEDIERIEILKGASAAAIYGSRASSGVVLITTKRGQVGRPRVRLSQTVGVNFLLNKQGTRDWTAEEVEEFFGADEVPVFQERGITDYEEELYGNEGFSTTSRMEIQGGNEASRYFAGFTYKDDEGIVAGTGYNKISGRFNIDTKVNDWLDLAFSTNYVRSKADRGFFNNDNSGTTMGISFVSTPPWADLFQNPDGTFPNNPYAASNFLQTAELVTNREGVDRFLSGLNGTVKIFTTENQSLRFVARGGLDFYNLQTRAIFPNELQFQKDGNGTEGASILGNVVNRNWNVNAFLVHNYVTNSNTSFRTQLGITQEKIDQDFTQTIATFLVGSQTNIDQASARNAIQNRTISTDKGFFLQEEVNVDDKVILTAGVRGDKSSRLTDPNELFFYPKASAAFNLHEFDLLGGPTFSTLKLRVAYGETGNPPPFGAIYENFNPVVIDGSAGAYVSARRGNPALMPERQKEIELGFDLGLFSNKALLEFTYYNKAVEDFILNVNVPTSSGFSTSWRNAGELVNNGIEIALAANIINNSNLSWDARFNWWTNQSEVTRLDVPAFNIGAFGATLGTYRIEEGFSPTQLVGIDPDADPERGISVFGDAQPDFQLSWLNSISYGNWQFDFLIHWKEGGENINLSTLLSDLSGTSPDYDDTDLDPDGEQVNGDYRVSALGVTAQPWIEDAGYIRLREVSLSYSIGRDKLNDVCDLRLGITGRNLINIFDYNSYDPEVSNFGTSAISSQVEVTPFPSARSIFFNIRADF